MKYLDRMAVEGLRIELPGRSDEELQAILDSTPRHHIFVAVFSAIMDEFAHDVSWLVNKLFKKN